MSPFPTRSHENIMMDTPQAILNGDLGTTSHLVMQHPELLSVTLDLSHGHNPFHMAVLIKDAQILAHLLSYCTGISR